MSGQSEDDAWRSIVENYGERPEVEPLPDPEPGRVYFAPSYDDDLEDLGDLDDEPDDRYVPPPAPAMPLPPPRRLAAWLGVFGSPALLLVALVAGVGLPGWLAYGLVAWFVGGFVYLVVMMDRGPRDPGDDGARL